MQYKVLVQKTYTVGHYVNVYAENADHAREQVRKALEGEEVEDFQELYDRIESDFEDIEAEIDEWFKDGNFILNSPPANVVNDPPNAAGIDLPEPGSKGLTHPSGNGVWGRPLVIEERPVLVRKGESQ